MHSKIMLKSFNKLLTCPICISNNVINYVSCTCIYIPNHLKHWHIYNFVDQKQEYFVNLNNIITHAKYILYQYKTMHNAWKIVCLLGNHLKKIGSKDHVLLCFTFLTMKICCFGLKSKCLFLGSVRLPEINIWFFRP